MIEAVQRRLVALPALRHEIEQGPRQGSRRLRRALADAEAGAWSIPEADLLALCAASTVLPGAWANPLVRAADGTALPRPDVWIDEVGLAVQVHSRRHHAGALDWESTVSRDACFVEHGVSVLAFTPSRIAREPEAVLACIERAYEAARHGPRPLVVAVQAAGAVRGVGGRA